MAKLSKRRMIYDGPQQMGYRWVRDFLGHPDRRVLGKYAEQEFGAGARDTFRCCWCDCCVCLPRKGRGGFGNHAGRGGRGWHPEGRLRERRSVRKKRNVTW